MAALLAKFRIDFSSVLVIPGRISMPYNGKLHHGICSDVTKRASEESRSKLNAKLAELPAGTIPEVVSYFLCFVWNMCLFQEELATNKEKTNRHLRLSELLQEHSSAAELIVMCAIFIFSLILSSCRKNFFFFTIFESQSLDVCYFSTNLRTLPMPRRGHTSAPLYLTWYDS